MRKMQNFILNGKQIFVGIEDSKSTWKICVRYNGMEVAYTSMPTKYAALLAYFKNSFPGCKIHCIYEAGFKGFGLHDRLTEDGIECTVIPPLLVTEPKVYLGRCQILHYSSISTDQQNFRTLLSTLENDGPNPEERQ